MSSAIPHLNIHSAGRQARGHLPTWVLGCRLGKREGGVCAILGGSPGILVNQPVIQQGAGLRHPGGGLGILASLSSSRPIASRRVKISSVMAYARALEGGEGGRGGGHVFMQER